MIGQVLDPNRVQEGFLAAPPFISKTIADLTVQRPSWYRDIYTIEEWPRGEGTVKEQLIIRGAMPQIEDGWENWKQLSNNQGCNPCSGPDCSYNWTRLGGNGIERRVCSLMSREFRSDNYCIKDIQTSAHYKEMMAQVVKNLYAQIDFFKEFNIGQNALRQLAKAYVVDSNGPQPNPQHPYVYRNVQGVRLGALNVYLLEWFYQFMRMMTDCVPYEMLNGSPLFALECSDQLLSHIYRDDPAIRWDLRYSSMADDLITKYNFVNSIRGMFVGCPILFPARFNIASNGEPLRVLPYVNGLPAEIGSYTGVNPDYIMATHEEVVLHGKYPFKVSYMPTETTLGANTSFGPELAFLNQWDWINPQTDTDPRRRVGFFMTEATIAIEQQNSEGIFKILVERPLLTQSVSFNVTSNCPPEVATCSNAVPAVSCPCPLILDVQADPVRSGYYNVQFSSPIEVSPRLNGTYGITYETIQFGLPSGGYVTGTVVDASDDGYWVTVSFGAGVTIETCRGFTSVFCDNTLGCSSVVLSTSDCRAGATGGIKLVLKNPIKAITAAQVIVATFGDGTTQHLAVVSCDLTTNEWIVEYAAGYGPTDDPDGNGGSNLELDFVCDRGGIATVCVPPSTDATCPACSAAPTFTQCS